MQGKHVSAIQPTNKARPGRAQNARPTIGYLVSEIQRDFAMLPWFGMMDAARQHDVNLISFIGGLLRPLSGFGEQANVLCDLAGVESLDGLIVWPSVMGGYLTPPELEEFYRRYDASMPLVILGEITGDVPRVTIDNDEGIRLAVDHLIEVHGYRRIAFVGMFEHNADLRKRYQAYTAVLEAHGLPVEAKLAKPWFPDEAIYPSGRIHEEVFSQWLKEAVADGVEAMVGVSDTIALEITELLQAQGVRIPEDVAVVGYDDFRQSRVVTPPLTTANPSFYESGQQAVEMLLAMMDGRPVPEQVTVPPRLMVRQSCGCLDPDVVRAAAAVQPAAQVKRAGTAFDRREVASAVVQAAGYEAMEGIQQEVERLVESFMTQVGGEGTGAFLSTLDGILRQIMAAGNDVTAWHNALSVLRRQTLPWLGESDVAARAEDLWQQARVMIGKTAERAQAFQRLQAEQRDDQLRDVSQTLITTFDMDNLMDVLAEGLPRLGIPSCYLALYENPRPYRYPQPAPEWSRLLLAYTGQGRIASEPGGWRFRSRELVPEGLWPQERQFSFVVEPLFFQEHQLGFVLFETGPREGTIYETLRAQISSALQGALLVQRGERRSAQLQTAAEVSRATSFILDLDELLSQTVDLICDRFGLYYTGLFLVDRAGEWTAEPGKWAVLRAGTGEAGRQMIAAGHKLEVGGSSMVGECIAHRQARIALDVGEETVRFSNPLLPHTRSELALPLVSRGQVIGAMTAQSDLPAAFTQEDIATLQSLADQLANAIANARLFAEHKQAEEVLARERNLLRTLIDNLPDYVFAKDTAGRFVVGNAALARHMGAATPDDLIGKSDFDFYPQELATRFYADEQALIQSGQPMLDQEEATRDAAGNPRWTLTTKVLLRDSQGKAIGLAGVSREITERMQSQLKLERNALQLQTAAEVSRVTSSILDLDELLSQTVELIRDRFGLYYTGLFLVDQIGERADGSDKRAVLRAGTGEAGRQMLAAGHKLEVGGSSMVGWCIANQQARIAQDVGEEAIHFDNPFLPATRSELALPLISRGNAIGAMTVQSDQPVAFSAEDITVLQTIADQVANAIENTRLFGQAQAAITEMETTQQRYVEQAWSSYVQSAVGLYHETTHSDMAPIGAVLLPEMQQAVEQKLPLALGGSRQPLDTASAHDPHAALVAPVMLRGQVIGVLGVQDQDTTRQWNDEEVTLIQTVAERLAQVLENLRLFEDAQRRAAQERLVGEVTTRVRATLDMNTILQTAVREIARALDAQQAELRLGTGSFSGPDKEMVDKSGGE